MKEQLLKIVEKIRPLYDFLHKKLLSGGKTTNIARILLLIDVAATVGIYLGLKVFFPEAYILTKINKALSSNNIEIVADSVGYSLFSSVTISDGAIHKNGEKAFTFEEITVSPSVSGMVLGKMAGSAELSGVNNKDGELHADFSTSQDETCFNLEMDETPLAVTSLMFDDIKLKGSMNGTAELCSGKKSSGAFDLTGENIFISGKMNTPMGALEIPEVKLGKMAFKATVKENKIDFTKLTFKGDLEIGIKGKVTMSQNSFKNGRLDLDLELKEGKPGALAKISVLEMMLERYKDATSKSYLIQLKGSAANPIIRKGRINTKKKKEEI